MGVAQRLLLQAQTALNSYAEPRLGGRTGLAGIRRPAAGTGPRRRRRARTISWRSSTRCATSVLSAAPPGGCWPTCSTTTRASAGWPDCRSTPICGGGSSPRWPRAAASTPTGRRRRSSTPRRSATRPRPGRRHAAAAAAARPQAEVKHRAWREVIEDDTLPNITARAIITGLAQPGQARLLAPYAAALLRRRRAGVGATLQRGGPDRGGRAVSVLGRQRRRPGGRRLVPGRPARAPGAAPAGPEGRAGVNAR